MVSFSTRFARGDRFTETSSFSLSSLNFRKTAYFLFDVGLIHTDGTVQFAIVQSFFKSYLRYGTAPQGEEGGRERYF